MTDATPSDKSPEQLRAEVGEMRAELGDTVEELAHRVDVPAQVRAKKEDTLLADSRRSARRRRPPCRRGADLVTEAGELAVYAPVAPRRVLVRACR